MRTTALILASLLIPCKVMSQDRPASTPNAHGGPSATSFPQEAIITEPTSILTDQYWFTRNATIGWTKGQRVPNLVQVPIITGSRVPTDLIKPRGLLVQGFSGEVGMRFGPENIYAVDLGGSAIFQGVRRIGPEPVYSAFDNQAVLLSMEERTRFFTIDANIRKALVQEAHRRVDLVMGYRFGYLNEDNTTALETQLGYGLFRMNDRADDRNQFHGAQVGIHARYRVWEWYLDLTTKVALGNVQSQGQLIGSSRASMEYGSEAAVYRRRLAELTETENHFAVLPTLTIRLSQQLTEHSRVVIGYEFLYISAVARPEQIFQVINARPSQVTWSRRTTDFWYQALSFGMEWRY